MQKNTNEYFEELIANQKGMMINGITLCLLGAITLILYIAGYTHGKILAIDFFVVAILLFLHAVQFWSNKSTGFIVYCIASLYYLIMTLFFYFDSIMRIYVGVLFCGVFFLLAGFRIYTGLTQLFNLRLGWHAVILSGTINLFFAISATYAFSKFPALLLPGMALDIIFTGISFIALAYGGKRLLEGK